MKDPAALLYMDKWYAATMEMKADARAYYMDLILHQFNKGSIPNDLEEIANICRVRISEYDSFKQVFEQVLKQKFELNDEGRLENEFAKEVIRKRESFKEKRSLAGKLSYILKFAREKLKLSQKDIKMIKEKLDPEIISDLDTKNEQMLEQVLNMCLDKKSNILNVNEDVINNIINKWNYLAENYGLAQIVKVTDTRERHVLSRLQEKEFDFLKILKVIEKTPFLLGNNKRGWRVDFDFIVSSKTNYIKILEGKYNGNNGKASPDFDIAKFAVETAEEFGEIGKQ